MIVFFYFIYEDGLKMITYMSFLYDSHIHVILKQILNKHQSYLRLTLIRAGFCGFSSGLKAGNSSCKIQNRVADDRFST